MIADRFCGGNVWSFHNPQGRTYSDPNTGGINGEGWHVVFTDGHVTFYQNEVGKYESGTPYNTATAWNDRYKNWRYWDENSN
jgi:hypothetical protein